RDEGARRRRAEIFLWCPTDREIITCAGRGTDGGGEDPPFEDHALPVALGVARHEDGTTGEARQTLAVGLLVEPGAVGSDSIARLGGEQRGRHEPHHNWKGAEGPARLHPLQYGKEAWAAHPRRPDRARWLGLPTRPRRQRHRA